MNIQITQAMPQDAPPIVEYLKIIGGETDNLTFGENGPFPSVEAEAKQIADWNSTANNIMLLAMDGDKIVGTANLRGNSKERMAHRGELGVTVLKEYWHNGIASQLIEKIIDFAVNAGITVISLEVRSDNTRAISLYKKYGFETIGVFRDFFKIDDNGIDFDLMNLYIK